MKTSVKIVFFVITLLTNKSSIADYVVTFFMRPYPHMPEKIKQITQKKADYKSQKLQLPGKIAKYTLRSMLETKAANGIFCTYKGQLTISDDNGQVTFSRKQNIKNVKILIAEKINPIFRKAQIIDHWKPELGASTPKLYSIKQKEDEETAVQFWNVKEISLPANNQIPLETIIIFARPKDIVVPEGITLIEQDAQLILPDIYVKKNINKLESSMYVLNLKRFFAFTKKDYTVKDKQYLLQTRGS